MAAGVAPLPLMVCNDFMTKPGADTTLKLCRELVLVRNRTFQMYGKACTMRRKTGFFAVDPAQIPMYRYSGQASVATPMPEWMRVLMDRVNSETGADYNAVLVNHYSDGGDYISQHSDDECGLSKKDGSVAMLSFGAPRRFQVHRKYPDKARVQEIFTGHGQLVVMQGHDFQKNYTHGIAKEMRCKTPVPTGDRFSLTFRQYMLCTE